MRPFPAVIAAVFLCACGSAPETGEQKTTDGAAAARESSATVRDDSVPAASLTAAPGLESSADTGGAELQRLAAAGKPILVEAGEEIAADQFVADVANTPSAYAGEYHFGDSESESTLTLAVQGNAVTGRLGYANWENDTWVGKKLRFGGGRIAGARLIAPGWSGVFVRYQGQPGLVILSAPTERLGVEFGNKLDTTGNEAP